MKILSAYMERMTINGKCLKPELVIITDELNVLISSKNLDMYAFIIDNEDILYLTDYLGSSKVSHTFDYESLIDLFIQIEDMYNMSIEEFSFGHISYVD